MSYAGQARPEEQKWDPALEPLMKFIVSRKGCKLKKASEVGKKKVDYFRGKDFANLLLKDADRTTRKCHAALAAHLSGKAPVDNNDIQILGMELLSNRFIQRAVYEPISGNTDSSKRRWPDRLKRVPLSQGWDPNGFYIVDYTGYQGWQYFLLACIIGVVLIGCLFPVWPFWAKIGGWYCVVIFLTIYFAVQIVRLILFIILWVIGTDFWILPNLNDESLGILDSFRPLYSYCKRRDGISMLFVRLFLLGFLVIVTNEISRTHSLSDFQDVLTGSYEDIIAWGEQRLTALPGRESDIPSLTYLEDLEKEINAMSEEEEAEAKAAAKKDGASGDEKAPSDGAETSGEETPNGAAETPGGAAESPSGTAGTPSGEKAERAEL